EAAQWRKPRGRGARAHVDMPSAPGTGVAHDVRPRLDGRKGNCHGFLLSGIGGGAVSTVTSVSVRSTIPSITCPFVTPRNVESRTTTPRNGFSFVPTMSKPYWLCSECIRSTTMLRTVGGKSPD